MKKMGVGVIGTGFVGPAHVEAVNRCGIAEVVAIAGSSAQKAQETAARLGVDRVYGNYAELIKDPDISVIHNCTPNHLHFAINKAVIAAGKHVISEKPLAMDSREAKLLLSATERSKVVHAVVYNYRHYPMVAQLRAMIQEGELGEIYAVHGSYLQDWLLHETDYNWRVDPRLGGVSRAIADIGSHWLDLVQFLLNQPVVELIADLRTFLPVRKRSTSAVGTFGRSTTPHHIAVDVKTEDYASVLFSLKNEIPGALTVSQMSAGRKNRLFLQVDGSLQSAAWDQEQPEILWLGRRDQPNETLLKDPHLLKEKARAYAHYPAGHGEAWADALKNFMLEVYQHISSRKKGGKNSPGFATFYNGCDAAVLVDKICVSSRQRRWVKTGLK
ncbi:MAG: gfo/Idh/MocA family oxidoreductase [Candidatus Abyssobacteria bacterium SURF_5]|uniref:Gfo/Idh/MocA family oxidoreductase n=1 Tax=Abyssobacteria bacterium (strain SURF_5) TaxID=2093360 RepID=A0A3A4MX05_ABYX5|nr:MAG: gfo/Idh/MocA family oxidoreductase [Candidatus Abyssubacteria bacterium SURF_5]